VAKWGRKGASRCSSGALLVLLWASKTRGAPRAEFAAWVRLMHASSGFGWGARGAHVSKLRPSFSLRGMLFQLGASCNFRAASCEPRVLVRKSPLTVCGPSAKFGLSNVWPQWQSAGECALLIARPPKTMSGRKEQSNNSRKLAPLLCCSLQIGIALFAQLGRWFLLGPPSGWLLWSSLKEKRKRGGASCAAQVVLHKLCCTSCAAQVVSTSARLALCCCLNAALTRQQQAPMQTASLHAQVFEWASQPAGSLASGRPSPLVTVVCGSGRRRVALRPVGCLPKCLSVRVSQWPSGQVAKCTVEQLATRLD